MQFHVKGTSSLYLQKIKQDTQSSEFRYRISQQLENVYFSSVYRKCNPLPKSDRDTLQAEINSMILIHTVHKLNLLSQKNHDIVTIKTSGTQRAIWSHVFGSFISDSIKSQKHIEDEIRSDVLKRDQMLSTRRIKIECFNMQLPQRRCMVKNANCFLKNETKPPHHTKRP